MPYPTDNLGGSSNLAVVSPWRLSGVTNTLQYTWIPSLRIDSQYKNNEVRFALVLYETKLYNESHKERAKAKRRDPFSTLLERIVVISLCLSLRLLACHVTIDTTDNNDAKGNIYTKLVFE